MPSEAEFEPSFDTKDKPFDTNKFLAKSGDPKAASDGLRVALGLPPEETTPSAQEESKETIKVDDPNAQKPVDKYSGIIQDLAEETYALASNKAKLDPTYLDKLVKSKDKYERKLAEKILSRNAETFGASTLEDYRVLKAKKGAGDDPVAQKIAEQEEKLSSLSEQLKQDSWESWKSSNSVSEDLAKVADELHSRFPNESYGDIVAFARGKMGITHVAGQKRASSVAPGSSGAPETDDALSSPLAARLLRGKIADTTKFAGKYLSGQIL